MLPLAELPLPKLPTVWLELEKGVGLVRLAVLAM